MDYILVSLEIPAIEELYEIFIPAFAEVDKLVDMLRKSVRDMSDGRYTPSGEEYLCSRETGTRFLGSVTLQQYGIRNGDHLLLI